jgi:hypothetical protein
VRSVRHPLLFLALTIGAALVVPAGVWTAAAERESLTFDDSAVGAPPPGFFFAGSRQANAGTWEVHGGPKARFLFHAADPSVTMRGIAVAGIDHPAPSDIRITAKLRFLDGDRAGGLIWRYRDADNFYFYSVVLADRRVNVIRVTGGNRIVLASATEIEPDPDAWHTLAIVHEGDQIRAVLNGIGILRTRDATMLDGGRAGIWSAGNSTTWFDDITIEDSRD